MTTTPEQTLEEAEEALATILRKMAEPEAPNTQTVEEIEAEWGRILREGR